MVVVLLEIDAESSSCQVGLRGKGKAPVHIMAKFKEWWKNLPQQHGCDLWADIVYRVSDVTITSSESEILKWNKWQSGARKSTVPYDPDPAGVSGVETAEKDRNRDKSPLPMGRGPAECEQLARSGHGNSSSLQSIASPRAIRTSDKMWWRNLF